MHIILIIITNLKYSLLRLMMLVCCGEDDQCEVMTVYRGLYHVHTAIHHLLMLYTLPKTNTTESQFFFKGWGSGVGEVVSNWILTSCQLDRVT